MRGDVRLMITRGRTPVWSCRAEAMRLAPADAEVDEAVAVSGVKARFRFHYTSKLDDMLRTPDQYNVEVLTRIVPSKTILAAQQSTCGRYIELSL